MVSNIFGIFIPKIGEMIQFDEHIFSHGLVQPPTSTWMSQEGSNSMVRKIGVEPTYQWGILGLITHLLIFTDLLLTSWDIQVPSLKLAASLPLKMDGWNTSFLSFWGV